MSKYKTDTSKETIQKAEKIAKATQRPGQTKEQTKLIAQGIQKGIEQYKKQYKAKARELDKKLKQLNNKANIPDEKTPLNAITKDQNKNNWLPWSLLMFSWVAFFIFIQN
ncbi:MAG: hypothetical protein COB38_03930 [Gammaproteobacteria bacterium]|nr:MAG: hypothetical protein COB38_03930 [Gammaproteobacteria bacterium]